MYIVSMRNKKDINMYNVSNYDWNITKQGSHNQPQLEVNPQTKYNMIRRTFRKKLFPKLFMNVFLSLEIFTVYYIVQVCIASYFDWKTTKLLSEKYVSQTSCSEKSSPQFSIIKKEKLLIHAHFERVLALMELHLEDI